ncbi:MAG: amidohydrolase family protein [Synergistetes bacterium]|nr:amidohydrolase family protein [Synergistota bacterium]
MRYLKDATIWTGEKLIENGWLLIKDGAIAEVGTGSIEDGESVSGKIIMPGFINMHSHLYSTLFRGFGISIMPITFKDILSEVWWQWDKKMDEKAVYYSALIGGIESLKAGITTIVDHHASYGYIKGSLRSLKEAVVDTLGMRADFCFEVSDRNGKEPAEKAIEENIEFAEETSGSSLLSAHIGLHASFTLGDETLIKVKKLTPEGIGFHIHLSEGIEDEIITRKVHGKSPTARLRDHGLLNQKSIVVHGIHLDEEEKNILKGQDVIFAHTPQSNMNNAVGTAYIRDLLQKGINVVLGTDGYSLNILNELRTLPLLQKHTKRDYNAIGLAELIKIWENGYSAASRLFGIKVGKIKPGYAADIIVADYEPFTPINDKNFYGHLLYGMTDRLNVLDVYINGKKVLSDGNPIGVEYHKVRQEAQAVAKKMWERMGYNA